MPFRDRFVVLAPASEYPAAIGFEIVPVVKGLILSPTFTTSILIKMKGHQRRKETKLRSR